MMRFFLINVVTIGFILASATSASAISFHFGAPSNPGPLNAGDTFSIQLRMNTQGETNITSVFISVFADPTLFSYVSGVSPGNILFNFSTSEGIPRVTQPFVLGGDPLGTVRAASFAALSPSGVANANQLLATLTFQAVLPGGVNSILSLGATGDDVTVSGSSVIGVSTFGSSVPITVVPEPGTALLMGLGLAGLAGAGRRKI